MSESYVQLNRTPNYRDLIVNKDFQRSDDELAHIEDTALFWVTRHGKPIRRTWNEMTSTEKLHQREADRRLVHLILNAPCEMGVS